MPSHVVTVMVTVPCEVRVDAKDDEDAVYEAFERLEQFGIEAAMACGAAYVRPSDFDSALVQELGDENDEPEFDGE